MPKTSQSRWNSRTKQELIIEVWEALDCESVGARELEQIQEALREKFGAGARESPAEIARTVADEGAVLRHPEVFDFDLKWREQHLFETLSLESLSFANLAEASRSIKKLDSLRKELDQADDQLGLSRLREVVLKLKHDTQLVAQSKILEKMVRMEAKEIVQWLAIWLQDPKIFEDWLSLRKRSPEFIQKFQG
jgi:hypothetical protein